MKQKRSGSSRAAIVLLAAWVAACAGGGPRSEPEVPEVVDGWRRLDRSVVPRRYDLDLEVDPRTPVFSGRVVIEVELSRAADAIRMHAEDLAFVSASVVQAGQTLAAAPVVGRNGGVALVPERPLAAGPARIEIAFAGRFPEVSHGLYRVEDGGHWYAFTQFQPLSARRAFPCFDQPEFKTPFRVKLRVPREMTALSSGPMVSRITQGERRTFVFAETRPIPTYLLAFAVGGFDETPVAGDPRRGPPMRIFAPAGRGAPSAWAAEHTPRILAWLEDWFGRPMPFAKLDQLAVPEFTFGAMENVGLVTYREPRLLLDPEHATARDQLWTAITIAHELSHMWFGNLVTPAWWDDLWLNESFASWMQTKAIDALEPELEAGLEAAAHAQYVMYLDSKRDARSVRQPIESGGDVFNAFDGITYGKGAAVLRMVESWIGEASFQAAVRAYLEAHAYGSGGTRELLAALDRASGEPVSTVVRGFVDRPGTPLVSAELRCDEDGIWPATLAIEQRRYLPAGRRDDSPPWQFPLCVRWASPGGNGSGGNGHGAAGGGRACFMVDAPRQELRLPAEHCPAWIHPNADEHGYYRWGLPEGQMLDLVDAYLDALTVRERLALPGGLRALLEAGNLSVEAYLEGLLALSADPHRRMAEAIVPGLAGLARIVEEEDGERFALYVRRILGPYLDRIGLEPRAGESRDAALLRSRLVVALADLGRDPRIRARARAAADALLDDRADGYTAEELRVYLPMASWDAGAAHWERLWARLRATESPTLRRNLLAALGSFGDPALLERSLALVLDGRLRAAEWGTVSGSVRRPVQRAAWDWIELHYDALIARIGPVHAARLPRMAAGLCSQADRDEVAAFYRRREDLPGLRRNLALALEDVERCAEARETVGEPMSRWLASLSEASFPTAR